MAEPLQTEFPYREALIAYLRETFPDFYDDYVSETRGGRSAAEAHLQAVNPARYAANRNLLDGDVTHLSAYLRHGVLSLREARLAVLRKAGRNAEKLVNELAWRDYWQRIYQQIGDGIWADREPYKTGWRASDYAAQLPVDLLNAETGLTCIDSFIADLYATGYLHNHARMWLAAYTVHHLRIRWQAGAAWFLMHLLDGDPASNNLSWQWVASTFSAKPYFFDRGNLERNTHGKYCRDCPLAQRGCPFDRPLEELAGQLFPHVNPETLGLAADPRRPTPDSVKKRQRSMNDLAQSPQPMVWVHGDCLRPTNPALLAYPDAPCLFVFDMDLLAEYQISFKRIVFMYECLLAIPGIQIYKGNVIQIVAQYAEANQSRTVITTDSPSPRFITYCRDLRERYGLEVKVLPEPPFVTLDKGEDQTLDLKRFNRYWSVVSRAAMQLDNDSE